MNKKDYGYSPRNEISYLEEKDDYLQQKQFNNKKIAKDIKNLKKFGGLRSEKL